MKKHSGHEMDRRIKVGSMFGFSKSFLTGFSTVLLPMYLSTMNISLIAYAFLLALADFVSFLIKPIVGYLTDRYGEKKFLLVGIFSYTVSLFLIGQTTSVFYIALLQVVAGVSSAFLLSAIMIFALRDVQKKPDRKVSIFGGITGSGWIFGLLLPGAVIDLFGTGAAFLLVLLIGLFLMTVVWKFSGDYVARPTKIDFSFVKKVPQPLLFKTIDMAVFNAFIIFFIRFALKSLGLSRSIISVIVAFESLAFAASEILVGRISDVKKRRHWIPLGMAIHTIGILVMLSSTTLPHYFIASGLFGLGGALIDIWVFSFVSEEIKRKNKGKAIAATGWSYDIGTIAGSQVPALMSFAAVNPFTSILLFPAAGFLSYYTFNRKR